MINLAQTPRKTGLNGIKRAERENINDAQSYQRSDTFCSNPTINQGGNCQDAERNISHPEVETGCKTVIIPTRFLTFKPVLTGGLISIALLRCLIRERKRVYFSSQVYNRDEAGVALCAELPTPLNTPGPGPIERQHSQHS